MCTLIIGICMHISAAGLEPATPSPQEDKLLFEERFASKLNDGWSWVREEPKAWRLEKDALVLRTLPGYLHGKSNNNRNMLLRTPPEVKGKPLAVEVCMESEPKIQFEHAGLVWYYDDDNYVSIWKEIHDGKQLLLMVTEKNAGPQFAQTAYKSKSVWLRLVVSGTKVISQYRESPEDHWRTVGESMLPVRGAPRVGISSGGTPTDAERYTRFRNFRIVELAK